MISQDVESFMREIITDNRLTMQERALLMYVMLSPNPLIINPVKLAADTKYGDRSFSSAMRKFYNIGLISPRYRMGVGFALVAYRLTYAEYQISKSVQANKYYTKKKIKLFERDWKPKKIDYGNTEIQYFDSPITEEELVTIPDVLNGVDAEE